MNAHPSLTHKRELISSDDPLRIHDLSFDARFAHGVVDYLEAPDDATVERLAQMPAATHLLHHAEHFDQPVPKSSITALVRHLIARSEEHRAAIKHGAAFFSGPLLDDPHWLGDVLRYLPADFRFDGSLFLIAGYDIGVALAPHASLNAAHQHFDDILASSSTTRSMSCTTSAS